MLRFAYRLAVKLGVVNVRKMLSEITYEEYCEWVIFSQLEPFDEERMDTRTAHICATLANVNRGKKTKAYQPQDFKIYFGDMKESKPRQTMEQQKAIARMFAGLDVPPAPKPGKSKRKGKK